MDEVTQKQAIAQVYRLLKSAKNIDCCIDGEWFVIRGHEWSIKFKENGNPSRVTGYHPQHGGALVTATDIEVHTDLSSIKYASREVVVYKLPIAIEFIG